VVYCLKFKLNYWKWFEVGIGLIMSINYNFIFIKPLAKQSSLNEFCVLILG